MPTDSGTAEAPPTPMNYHDRLVQFYTEHNPYKISSIEDLLKKYEGDEEALIQKVHLKYGVRDLVSQETVDDLFENERYSYLTMTFGSTYMSYPGHLLVLDRKRWSTASGTPSSQDMHEVEPTLPDGYEWTGPWAIDSTYANCDADGWTYAFDFSNFKAMLLNDESRDSAGMADYVRRRRWTRPRRRRSVPNQAPPLNQPSTAEAPSNASEQDEVVVVHALMPPAPTAPPSPYRHFAATISMSELQSAWILHLHALNSVHSKLNHARAARVLRWRLAKAKLRAQLATLTRASSSQSAHHQSKVDLIKRAIWFPADKGYIWRASLVGVFVGVQDFWVERLALTFQLAFTESTRLVASFQGALCGQFHGIKVKGDKGTRIPNAKWTQVDVDTRFRGRWVLRCDGRMGWALDQDTSTPVDFTSMNMQYRGGLGIPDTLAQLVLQDLATNYITHVVATLLPPELSKLMLRPTSGIEMAGELAVDGLDLATIVHCKNLRATTGKVDSDPASQVLQLLNLTRPQLNVLLATRQYNGLDMLFPSLAQFATYVRLHALDSRPDDKLVVEGLTKEWIDTWDRILELLQLQRQLSAKSKVSYDMAPLAFDQLVAHTKRHVLQKQLPVRVHLTQLKCRVHVPTMLHTLSAWATHMTTRVSTSAAAKVMGIRLGRKKDLPPQDVADVGTPALATVVLDGLKRLAEMGLVRHLHTALEGKVTGVGRTSATDDALVRLQFHDVQVDACGPVDWSTSLAWARSVGRVSISTTLPEPCARPSVKLTLQPKASSTLVDSLAIDSVVSATLTGVQSSLVLDATHLSGDVVVCSVEYGTAPAPTDGAAAPTNLLMRWHRALVAKLRVESIHAVASLRALFQVGVDVLLQTLPLPSSAKHWLDKLVATALKYCSSDALLIAWSVVTSLDDDGMWSCDRAGDHPQPFLYFDQLHLLTLLHDVDDLVAFAIHMHDNADDASAADPGLAVASK